MNEFYVFIVVRNSDRAIMRVFCTEELCDSFIKKINEEDPEDPSHKEVYYLIQKKDWS